MPVRFKIDRNLSFNARNQQSDNRKLLFRYIESGVSYITLEMFDVFLAVHLTAHTFSMKKGSLRFPTARRVFSALFILPFFFVLILINKIFMLLDWVLFPGFMKMKLRKSSFIIGVPRSATTYLFNILAKDGEHFTCFKFWELLFAPSVIQKYILSGILRLDRWVGRPLYRLSLLMDRIFLRKIALLHETSLSRPEEDEMLFVYAFASMYLAFFFPDVPALNPHLFFDEDLSPVKRRKLMLFYKRCVQRHVYVFDRKEEKRFLSKNPSFISKTVTLAETFPEATLVYMLRSPYQTIPSTISLNLNVYSIFSGQKNENPLSDKTTEAIIRWYTMADDSIAKHWGHRNIVIPFKRITRHPEKTIKTIYEFLELMPGEAMNLVLQAEQENSNNYKSGHLYNSEPGRFEEEISLRLDFIFNGKYSNEI
jgi:omega-hydroxy-beta-dihydromenaquinone-9 sulfotransferase